jgi:hypothetical protein
MYVGFFFASLSSKNQKVLFLSSKRRHTRAHTHTKEEEEEEEIKKHLTKCLQAIELESIHSI